MKLYYDWVDKFVPMSIGFKTPGFAIYSWEMANQLWHTLEVILRSTVRKTK